MWIFYGFKVPAGPAQMESCLTALSNSSPASREVSVAETVVHYGTSAEHSQTHRTWLSTNIEASVDNRGVPTSQEGPATRTLRQLGCSIATDTKPMGSKDCLRSGSMPTERIACSARATAEERQFLEIPLWPSSFSKGENNSTARSEQTEYTTCPDKL